jgi:hypothetical protein
MTKRYLDFTMFNKQDKLKRCESFDDLVFISNHKSKGNDEKIFLHNSY